MAKADEGGNTQPPPLDTHERAAQAAARAVPPPPPYPVYPSETQTRTPAEQDAFIKSRGISGANTRPPGQPSVQPVDTSVPAPASQPNDYSPPGAAQQNVPTQAQDFYAPEFIRGNERMGSGGARYETSQALRDYLNANGVPQSDAFGHTPPPGKVLIDGQYVRPSDLGIPDHVAVELFGPHGEIAGSPVEDLVKQAYANAHKAAGVAQQRAGERSAGATMYRGNLDPATEARLRAAGLDPTTHVAYGPGDQSPQLDPTKATPQLSDIPGASIVADKVGQGLAMLEKPWTSFLGRTLIAVGGQTNQFNALVSRRLQARGVVDPSYFDTANEAGDVAAELFARASAEGPPIVGGLAQAANPVWWIAAPAGAVKLGSVLATAGVDARVAGFIESMIANGGLPYADRALNAVFINGATRGAARAIGATSSASGEAVIAALRAHLPEGVANFVTDEAGTLNVEALREMLGIAQRAPSPRAVMAQLRGIAREHDDPALREQILGPGGGLYRVASSGGASRETLGMESLTSSRGGGGLVVGQGSSAVETAALKAHRAQFVDPYKSVADEFDAVSTQIDQITKSRDLAWGSLEPQEQFRQLALEDDRWTPFYEAFRAAPDDQTRRAILDSGRKLADAMQYEKGVPIGESDAQKYPGANATGLLTKKAVLEARLRSLWEQANDLLANVQRPTIVPKVHTVTQRSARAFDVMTPDGRLVGTERTLKGAQQRAHDLDLSQMQTTMPGTPDAQAPSMTLENQVATPSVGPGGEQLTIQTPAERLKQIEPLTNRGIKPSTVEAFSAKTTPSGTPDRRVADIPVANDRRGLPGTVNAETLSQRIGIPQTPSQEFPRYQVLPGGRVVDLQDNKVITTIADQAAARAEAARLNAAAGPKPAAAKAAPRFEVRGDQIYDTKLGKVDEILTAKADAQGHSTPESALVTRTRWAKWADRLNAEGKWREHAPLVPEGQKLVPTEAQIVPPGEVSVPKTPPGVPPELPKGPPAPPGKGDLFPPDQPPVDEGPSTVIWRVVDRGDGTFGLGRIDLNTGLTIGGERFTDREGALITAEARNAADDAVTMVGDAIDYLTNTLEGIPPQTQLMSPGQAKAVNAALRAERQAAEAEVARARAEYLRAAEGYGRTVNRQADARVLRAAREHARGLTAEARRVHGTPPVRGSIEQRRIIEERVQTQLAQASPASPPSPPPPAVSGSPVQGTLGGFEKPSAVLADAAGEFLSSIPGTLSSTSRMFGTAYDLGTAFRQLRTYAASHPRVWAFGVKGGAESYARPEVVAERVRKLWAGQGDTVSKWSTGELYFRGPDEFTGEAVKPVSKLEAVPIAGGALTRSNAAFNSSINLVNGRVFVEKMAAIERSVAKGERQMPTTDEIRRFEWVLNKLSGRGYDPNDLHGKLQVLHQVASFLYSPQWQASRLGMYGELKTTMWNIAKLPTGRRLDIADQEVLRSALAQLGSDTLILAGAARMTGADIETDPHHTNFARLPLGDARPELVPWVTALSGLGVGVQTYSDGTVWADFSAGYGADFRLMAQLLPIGGDYGFFGTPLGSAKAISASGAEGDPYNPQRFGERNVQQILTDWFTSRGDPRTRMVASVIGARGGQDPGLGERVISGIISAFTPMLLQDAVEASGTTQDLSWEGWLSDIQKGGHWFSNDPTAPVGPSAPPSAGPGTTIRPGTSPRPTGSGFFQQYGR